MSMDKCSCGALKKAEYAQCYNCLRKLKKAEEKKPKEIQVIKPELELKDIKTALWRLVNYTEYELKQKGLDPKKIRDESWKEAQEDTTNEILP